MRRNPVNLWLYLCCGMIFVMALLGAITRLTESGLSITHWDPVMGALPPLNETAWQKAFADYQTIPQYRVFNQGMSLEEFKHIYFWEWFHRLWGRLIGFVFAVPLIGFLLAKKIDGTFFLKLAAIFALGGLQGFIGWFMVQSGLEVRTTVSPYRLALHLGFALLLYALLLWTALNNRPHRIFAKTERCPLAQGWATLALLVVTILWGALVAGTRAGFAYNTWPLMDGAVLPQTAWVLKPGWLNFFENTALVQFTHRWLAPATLLAILAWVARCWPKADEQRKMWLGSLAFMALAQITLGLSTLLTHVQLAIAVTHQAGAILLLTLMLVNLHGMTRDQK